MCLELHRGYTTETKAFQKKKSPILAYKVVTYQLLSMYSPSTCRWLSGLNTSSRKSTRLTKEERKQKEIDEGFHFFVDLEIAIKFIERRFWWTSHNPRILECIIDPKDVVAVGKWEYARDKECSSIVATKAIAITKMKVIDGQPEVY